jgi:hypothetical protein
VRFLEDITILVFLFREDPLEVSKPLTKRLEGEVDLPIEANLLRELDREEVEKTDLISPLMLPFFDLDDPVVSYFLSLKLF